MSTSRLYSRPEKTREVLREIIKGADNQEELAEALEVAKRTVHNRVHDPAILDLVSREDGVYEINSEYEDEIMKLLQLKDKKVLEDRFLDTSGVEKVKKELEEVEELSHERIGRLISYHTDSQAVDDETFKSYGRTYAQWFDYLSIQGYSTQDRLYLEKPPGEEIETMTQNRGGLSYPKVRPDKVIESLQLFHKGVKDKSELCERFDYSERSAAKHISTCRLLNLVEDNNDEIKLTEFGKKVINANESGRRELIRGALKNLEFVEEYNEIAPNESPFRNRDIIHKIDERHNKRWSEGTIETRSKRIYRWLIYSGLYEEVRRGILRSPSTKTSEPGQVEISAIGGQKDD